MPRSAHFDQDGILDAALRVVAAHGPPGMTTEAIAAEMGGHVGSIYYRFPTKDHLLAQLWMRCAHRGQAGLLDALKRDDLNDAVDHAVLHYPRWSRQELAPAQVLAAYGREQLTPRWPNELAAMLTTINDDLISAVREFAHRWYDDNVSRDRQRAVTFAVLDLPASAIRRYLLASRPPPESLDQPILAAARAALAAA